MVSHVSIIFVIFFSSHLDFPRFWEQKTDYRRPHGNEIQSINNGQAYRTGEKRYVPNRVLVKFKPTLSTQTKDATLNAYRVKTIEHIPALDVYLAEISPYSTVEETVYALRLNPDVAQVSPDYKTYITAVPKPTDNFFNWQYYLYNEGQEIGLFGPSGKNRADIKALEAWEETKGDNTVLIAVIDTGIDFDHPDLEGKIYSSGKDFVNNDNDASDDHGHGTFVSGLIAAKSNNGEGIAGVNWHSQILPLKAVGPDGTGDVSMLEKAILYAADSDVDVISMSLGFSMGTNENAPGLKDALSYAYEKGVVCVASAGNEGAGVLYPAAYDDYCIAVAATDYNDTRPSWSNFGPEVDIAAPGSKIIGPVPTWLPALIWNDFTLPPYGFADGTSASAAIVSGFVALIRSVKPWLQPDDLMNVIRYSADDVNGNDYPGEDDFIGSGRINMEKALVPIILSRSK